MMKSKVKDMKQFMLEQFKASTKMTEIYETELGAVIMGAWSRDVGTMERRLKLMVICPDSEVSPALEFRKSKLTSKKALLRLADIDGVPVDEMEGIYKAIISNEKNLNLEYDSTGKCSLIQAYEELCKFVKNYAYPGQVFIKDGYGNILATELKSVIGRLGLGYARMELQKEFSSRGLLRTSKSAGHFYSYKINTGARNDWYFSFKLPRDEPLMEKEEETPADNTGDTPAERWKVTVVENRKEAA